LDPKQAEGDAGPATLPRHGASRVTDAPAERAAENIWTSLRRRKVVQWGLAYAAGAWALLEVLGFATDAFAWPAITKPLAMLGLAVGLPIVVALAWYHGDRGQQRVTGHELAVLTLLLFLGGGLLWLYAKRSAPTASTVAAVNPAPTLAATDARPSIAVLPFENRSREADDVFFVDGIHDDILTQLSKVSALRVISRTSVEQFRDTKLPMKAIAEQLGVARILEGGVQRAGERVRIHVQLIDAASDAHLWAKKYARELTAANIFAIQTEIATAIAGELKATLTPAERARAKIVPTQNLAAWEAYQLGKQLMAKRSSAGIGDAQLRGAGPRSEVRACSRRTGGHTDSAVALQARATGIDPCPRGEGSVSSTGGPWRTPRAPGRRSRSSASPRIPTRGRRSSRSSRCWVALSDAVNPKMPKSDGQPTFGPSGHRWSAGSAGKLAQGQGRTS